MYIILCKNVSDDPEETWFADHSTGEEVYYDRGKAELQLISHKNKKYYDPETTIFKIFRLVGE